MASRVAQFQTLVDRQPDNELFRFSLAQALLDENRPAEAQSHFAHCAARKPDWMMARILLGKCLLATGQPAEARREFEQALHLARVQQHEEPEQELLALLAALEA